MFNSPPVMTSFMNSPWPNYTLNIKTPMQSNKDDSNDHYHHRFISSKKWWDNYLVNQFFSCLFLIQIQPRPLVHYVLITLCYILREKLESHTNLYCTSFGFHIARQTFSESYIKISMLFLSFQSFTISDRIGEMTSPIEVSGRDGYRGWGCLWRSTPVLCSIVWCSRFCCDMLWHSVRRVTSCRNP